MRNRFVFAIASLVIGGLLGMSAPAAAQTTNPASGPKFGFGVVRLNGAQEIGPTGQAGVGDPDGRGTFAYLAFDDKLCYLLIAKRIDTPVAAHIHAAPRGANGGIRVFLDTPTDGLSADCITAEPDPALDTPMILVQAELDAIIANPADFYANVHTGLFPAGAIRGQLA